MPRQCLKIPISRAFLSTDSVKRMGRSRTNGRTPGIPPVWVNYSIHGPGPGRRYRIFSRFSLKWPPAASVPQINLMAQAPLPPAPRRCRKFFFPVSAWNGLGRPRDPKNRHPTGYLDEFLTSFIKFHCNRTIFQVFWGSGAGNRVFYEGSGAWYRGGFTLW